MINHAERIRQQYRIVRTYPIIVLSDPKTGSEESLGRLFNALAAVYDFKQRGDDVQLLFQGAGTRWAGELVNQAHPIEEIKRMNEPLYEHIEKLEAEIELLKVIEDEARPA